MADITIYGSPNSTFVRTARLAFEEKGVAYGIDPVGEDGADSIKSDTHLARHPWGKIPAIRHGQLTLFESLAIGRYVDEAFDGPALQPADVKERAMMTQWYSAIVDHVVPDVVFGYVLAFARPSGPDGKPDMARVQELTPIVRNHFEIIDRALEGRTYLAGDAISLADLVLIPPCHYLGNFPGGMEIYAGLGNLGRWWEAVSARPSFKATVPPAIERLKQSAA